MKKRLPFVIGAVLVTAFIFSNSLKDATASTVSSNRIVGFFDRILNFLDINISTGFLVLLVRKSAHITEFFAQSVMIANSFKSKYSKRIVYILFFGLLTACTDEFLQMFSDGRSAEVVDVFIDFSGCVVATVVCGIVYYFRRKKKCRV